MIDCALWILGKLIDIKYKAILKGQNFYLIDFVEGRYRHMPYPGNSNIITRPGVDRVKPKGTKAWF